MTLHPGQARLEQKTTLYNPGPERHRFYWWTNAGVQVSDDSRLYYPQDYSVTHGFVDLDTWPVDRNGVDLSVVRNHRFGPVSRFSYASNEPYMGVYNPKIDAGVVHYSARTDLPSKKVFSWGSDAEGLEWRNALSDNHSAYVEIQAGLFRDQETYGFLDPQQAIHFTEIWMPVLEIGTITYANADVILSLQRTPPPGNAKNSDLDVALNVTRDFSNAKIANSRRKQARRFRDRVAFAPIHLSKASSEPAAQIGPYTVTLTDEAGKTILAHTQGHYDFLPVSDLSKELPPAYTYPSVEHRSESDFLGLGNKQESDGEALIALATYREGLKRYPDSFVLDRAAGRLDVGLKRFDDAITQLTPVLARVSTDKEASYYLGLAYAATGGIAKSPPRLRSERTVWYLSRSVAL